MTSSLFTMHSGNLSLRNRPFKPLLTMLRTMQKIALFAIISGFIFSVILKFLPGFVDLSFLNPLGFSVLVNGVYEIPFLDRMAIVFILCVIGMYIISTIETRKGVHPHGLEIDPKMFK